MVRHVIVRHVPTQDAFLSCATVDNRRHDITRKLAINGKGVGMGCYIGTPLNLRPRHQDFHYYGRGCPWRCPHALRQVEYKKGDLPVAEKLCETEMELYGSCYYKPAKARMRQIARAVREVVEHADEVPRSEKCPVGSNQ